MVRLGLLLCICAACKGGSSARRDGATPSDGVLIDGVLIDGALIDSAVIDGPPDAMVDAMLDAPPDALVLPDAPVAGFAQRAYLKASNTGAADQFHVLAISADGTTVAVGAPYEDSAATGINGDQTNNMAPDAGAVYVFTRSGVTWMQQAYIKASNAQASDEFGSSVALSADGSTLAVGAIGERSKATGIDGDQTDNSIFRAGAAYVFVRSGTTWSQHAYVKASNTFRTDVYLSNERFGASVALSADGSTLAVAADYEDGMSPGVNGDQYAQGIRFAGAVYVFVRGATTWAQQAYIKASNPGMDDAFGRSLAVSGDGDTLAVGAKYESSAATGINGDQSNDTASTAGAVYVFARSGTLWAQQAYVKASNTGAGDYFGHTVALSSTGSVLAVGANGESSGTGNQMDESAFRAGAAYVFTRTGTAWAQQQYVKASNIGADDFFGSAVALSADGTKLVVGAFGEASAGTGIAANQADDSATRAGAVYTFERVTTWMQTRYLKASNTNAGDELGHTVATSADAAVLAASARYEDSAATGIDGNWFDNSLMDAGAVYLFYEP